MIKSSEKEILLGINLHSELKFEEHVNLMYVKKQAKKNKENKKTCPNCTVHGSKAEEKHYESIC